MLLPLLILAAAKKEGGCLTFLNLSFKLVLSLHPLISHLSRIDWPEMSMLRVK